MAGVQRPQPRLGPLLGAAAQRAPRPPVRALRRRHRRHRRPRPLGAARVGRHRRGAARWLRRGASRRVRPARARRGADHPVRARRADPRAPSGPRSQRRHAAGDGGDRRPPRPRRADRPRPPEPEGALPAGADRALRRLAALRRAALRRLDARARAAGRDHPAPGAAVTDDPGHRRRLGVVDRAASRSRATTGSRAGWPRSTSTLRPTAASTGSPTSGWSTPSRSIRALMEGGLSVAVLIPTFRRPEELARCLAALAAQRRRPDRVVVVARAEDEPTRRVAAASRGLTVERVLVEAPGQVAALNAGLDALREDVVAITDDDCIPRPDWLERIERHFAADPRLGGLGGPDRLVQGGMPVVGARRSVGRVFWYGRFVGLHQLGIGPVRDVELLKGANMSYRREAVARLRFDTHLRGSGTEQHNDWAFSLAVGAAGWRVAFDPAVAVDHDEAARAVGNPRFAADPLVAAEHAHNQTYAAVRHLPPRRVAAHLLYSALIGTTTSPGVVMTVVNLLSGHEPRSASLLRFRLALRARADGAATGLRERRRAGGPAAAS